MAALLRVPWSPRAAALAESTGNALRVGSCSLQAKGEVQMMSVDPMQCLSLSHTCQVHTVLQCFTLYSTPLCTSQHLDAHLE